ncbi:MAG: DUF4347 domain-containing protein [Gammaproteobacteria bacterium]|jgi:VCBS repeat-containing protein
MKKRPDKPAQLESMEPRLLFSADVAGIMGVDALPTEVVLSTAQAELLVSGSQAGSDTQSTTEIRQELVFVDTASPDYQQLVDDLVASRDNTRQLSIYYLDGGRDGVEQISQVLSQQQDLSAIHLVSHGNDHALQLGATWLDGNTLQEHRLAIESWQSALAGDADILVYGCELAGSDAGIALVNSLSQLTGADIAASDDLTGDARLGGDWAFEYRTGGIETAVAFSGELQQNWTGVLSATRAGSEFQVNTTTAGDQDTAQIAMDSAGNFVVTWTGQGQDGSGTGILAQRYATDGTPLGTEFQVNSITAGDQLNSRVTMANNGDFLVVWEGHQDGNANIYARLFDSTGTPQGAEFQINATTAGDQLNPAVAMKNNGDFVVAWQSDDGSGNGIFARLFDRNGTPRTAEVQINSATAGDQVNATVAIRNNGDFMVSWDSDSQDSDGWGVFARLFDKNGAPLTAEIQVNETVTGDQQYNDLAMDNSGNFVIVWNGNGSGGDATGIHGRLFDSGGNPLGSEFQINTNTGNTQQSPAVAITKTGEFVVTWQSDLQDGDGIGIFARQFASTGTPLGGELMINSTTGDDQALPDVEMKAGDEFVVVWQGRNQDAGPPAGSWGVFGQRYASGTNTAPVITLPGGALDYMENDPATVIDAAATVSDADSADFDTGSLTVDFTAGGTLNDRIAIRNAGAGSGEIGVSGSTVSYEGNAIGTFSGGTDGLTPLLISLNNGADTAAVQALVRSISYQNVSDDPATGSRTIRFILDDGDGSLSTPVTKTINVAAANDVPVVSNLSSTATEDGPGVTVNFVVSDPDAGDTHTFTITGGPAEGSVVNNNDGSFTFDPGSDFQDLAIGETRNVSFTYKASDGTSDSAVNASVTVTVTGSNDAPATGDDSFAVNEDATLNDSVLANDSDIDHDTLTARLVSGTANGTLVLNPDGSFSYTPDAGFSGHDSFTYLADDGNGVTSTATVTITVNESIALPGEGDNPAVTPGALPVSDTGNSSANAVNTDLISAMPNNDAAAKSGHTAQATYIEALGQLTLAGDESQEDLSGYSFVQSDESANATGEHRSHTYGKPGLSFMQSLKSTLEPDSGLWDVIETMKNQMSGRHSSDEPMVSLLAKSVTGMTLTLSAGIATWALRGGSLLAGMLSSMPLWKGFDPLPIIAASRREREEAENDSGSGNSEEERKAADMFDSEPHGTDASAGKRGIHE